MQDMNSYGYYAAESYMPAQVLESVALTESTTNPATFFSRYDLAIERATALMKTTRALINGRPAKDYVRMLMNERDSRTINFITRCCRANRFSKLVAYVEAESPNWSDKVESYYRQQYEQWKLYH